MSVPFVCLLTPEVDEFKIALTVVAKWMKKHTRNIPEHAFLLSLAVKIENDGIVGLAQWTEEERLVLSFTLAEITQVNSPSRRLTPTVCSAMRICFNILKKYSDPRVHVDFPTHFDEFTEKMTPFTPAQTAWLRSDVVKNRVSNSYDELVHVLYQNFMNSITSEEQARSEAISRERFNAPDFNFDIPRSENPTAASSTDPPPPAPKPDCVVCMEREATWVFNECGHLCLCKACSRKFNKKKTAPLCPICRGKGKAVSLGHYEGEVFKP